MPAVTDIYGCRTPIVLEWNDPNLDYVEVAMYIHAGSAASDTSPSLPSTVTYTLKIPVTGGRAILDIAPFCRDFIEARHFTDDRFYFCHTYVRKTISGSIGVWSREFTPIVGTGYNYSFQRQNTGTAQGIAVGETLTNNKSIANKRDTGKYILSDAPWMVAPESHQVNIPVRADSEQTSGNEIVFASANFANGWNNGSTISDFTIIGNTQSRYFADADSNTSRIYGLQLTDTTSEVGVVYKEGSPNELIEYMGIKRICIGGGGGTTFTKHRYTKFIFVNKYGAREAFFMFGKRREEWDNESTIIDRTKRVGMTHDRHAPMRQQRYSGTNRKLIVDTGNVYDWKHNEVLRQLILSEQIWVFDNYEASSFNGRVIGAVQGWKPVILKNHNWDFNWDHTQWQNATFEFLYADDQLGGTI